MHQIELELQNEELRRAQLELEAGRARYFDLYDLAPVGYVTLSESGRILEANLTASTLLGVARGALIKHHLSNFILSEDKDTYYLHHKKLLETGTPQAFDMRTVRRDGSAFWAHLEASAAQDGGGGAGFRVVISDITDRKRAEAEKEQLEAVTRHLQKSDSLGRMAGAIAHHFNNQLHVVTGHLEMAVSELPEGGRVCENLTEALRATRRASEVSTLMLTYLGEAITTREPLDLSETYRRSLPMLQAVIPKNVALEFDASSPGPVVRANPNQLQQLLTNLVTNAWESAGSASCVVRVSVTTAVSAQIPASHRFPVDWQTRHDVCACLEVADTGCGIAPNAIDDLFDPFFSSKFTGRGMGLPVVLGIVRAHEGAVTVESDQGSGSVFRVYLPLTAEAVPRQPETLAKAPELKRGGTVLLVEDEEMVRNVAAAMLERLGFGVRSVKDGVEAVEVLQQRTDDIQCVLCDLTMPRMNGWETLTALRHLAPGIPVILASGYSEAQVMEGAHPELPQAYLRKPYPMAELKDALAKAMRP